LLIATGALFGQGFNGLLEHEPTIDFLGCEIDPDKAFGRVSSLKPDVVVLVRDNAINDLGDTLRSALRACGRIRLIEPDLEDGAISVYSGKRQVARKFQDLTLAIAGAAPP
jgi:hypothetical protein